MITLNKTLLTKVLKASKAKQFYLQNDEKNLYFKVYTSTIKYEKTFDLQIVGQTPIAQNINCSIDAKLFLKTVSKLDSFLDLKFIDDKIIINGKISLATQENNLNFEIIKPASTSSTFLNISELQRVKKLLIPFVLNDKKSTKTQIKTLYLDTDKAVSTDGNILAMWVMTNPLPSNVPSLSIPVEHLPLIESIEDGSIEHFYDADYSKLIITNDTEFLSIELCDIPYPNYKSIIPTTHEAKIKINIETLLNDLTFFSSLCDKELRAVKFTFKDSKIALEKRTPSVEHKDNSYCIVSMPNDYEREILLDCPNLINVCKAYQSLGCETVTLELGKPKDTFIISSDDNQELSFVMIETRIKEGSNY